MSLSNICNFKVGFFRRFIAFILDSIMFIMIYGFFKLEFGLINLLINNIFNGDAYSTLSSSVYLLPLIHFLYYFICWFLHGATIGENLMKTYVVNIKGGNLKIKNILKRYLVIILIISPIFIAYILCFLFYKVWFPNNTNATAPIIAIIISYILTFFLSIICNIPKYQANKRVTFIDRLSNTYTVIK